MDLAMKVLVYVVSPKHNEPSVQYFIQTIIHILNLHPSFNPNVALKHLYTFSPLLHFANQHVFEQQKLKRYRCNDIFMNRKIHGCYTSAIQHNLHIDLAK